MKIRNARIRGYRTIKEEIDVRLDKGITLVGPNNSGKTNVMKAIRLFFTGYSNVFQYSRTKDLSIGEDKINTSISLTFLLEDGPNDNELLETLSLIRKLLDVSESSGNEIAVYLTFSVNSNPTYRVYPNIKRPKDPAQKTQYSRLERKLVDGIIERVSIHYIPSDKSIEQLYYDLVVPFLKRKSFEAIQDHFDQIKEAMDQTASLLNNSLEMAGLGHISCSFVFPQDPNRIFNDIEFSVKDPDSTSIFSKGMGIQSAALLSAFNWITKQEVLSGKNVVWLLEEPESYLHPELAKQCEQIIGELRGVSQVFSTTHSISFVPQDPNEVIGISLENGKTKTSTFKTYYEATERIRTSLGVEFSDFFNLNRYNVFLEGPTDRKYFQDILEILSKIEPNDDFPFLRSMETTFLDFGGVSALKNFAQATYRFIQKERPCVLVFDGDEAGDKAQRDLTHFFGQKNVRFQPNVNYVIVRDRFAIEGLFPDSWLTEIHGEHSQWFDDFSVDAQGQMRPFRVKDGNKNSFYGRMIERAKSESDLDWASRWRALFSAVEEGLKKQSLDIYGSGLPLTSSRRW